MSNQGFIGMQRAVALKAAGLKARELMREGYATDADRILEEIYDRLENGWLLVGDAEPLAKGT